MAYKVVVKMGSGAFFVPNEAVENLKLCTATQLKLLLLAFSRGFSEITPEGAAAELNISVEEAKDNLDYWVNRGLLESDGKVQKAAVPSPAPVAQPVSAPAETIGIPPVKQPPEKLLEIDEVERLKKEDKDVAFAFSEAERILGCTFTTTDSQTLAWLVAYAGIVPEVLVMVMEYCTSFGQRKIRFIAKTAKEWLDEGINTVENAEIKIQALQEYHSWEGEVKRCLGISGRSLIKKEKEFAENWRLYSIPLELITFAYEKCILNTGKLSFAYINKVLLNWHQKGFKTVAEVEADAKPQAEKAEPSFNLGELEQRMLLDDGIF